MSHSKADQWLDRIDSEDRTAKEIARLRAALKEIAELEVNMDYGGEYRELARRALDG